MNCGISFTKPLLQRALNLLNRQGKEDWVDLKVDGEYGPATLQALIKYIKTVVRKVKKCWYGLILCKASAILKLRKQMKHEQFFYGWLC